MIVLVFVGLHVVLGLLALAALTKVRYAGSGDKRGEAIGTDADFACDALVTRVFEQRLVDAGIITVAEMTTCESPACRDCRPTTAIKSLRKPPPGGGPAHKANPPLVVGGQKIPWPERVPQHAAVEVVRPTNPYNNYVVNWLWIDTKTARQMHYSVKVADMTGTK